MDVSGSAATQYVYSLGTRPLAEYEAAAWEYLLADPLGSVRQLADPSGNVTLLKSYEPYGSVLNSQGSATSIFGYAGEQVDAYIKLIFLRARYYSPEDARFLSKDVWQGDYTRPHSFNGWSYVEGNPVNFSDPSGLCREGDIYCEYIADRIEKEFQVEVDRGGFDPTISCAEPGISVNWISEELLTVEKALDLTKTFLDQTRRPFIGAVGGRGYTISRVQFSSGPNPDATLTSFAWPNPLTSAPKVQTTTPDALFAQPVEYSIIAILIHEFFHAFDYFTAQAQFLPQVQVIMVSSDPTFSEPFDALKRDPHYHHPGRSNYCGPSRYACTSQGENFADSAAVYALEYLNLFHGGEAGRVLDFYRDYGGGGPIKRIEYWDDQRARLRFLDNLFFGYPDLEETLILLGRLGCDPNHPYVNSWICNR